VPIAPLRDLSSGTVAVIDANIFIYALRRLSPQCQNLLERCRAQEVFGVTTLEVINEVSHRLMLAEAVEEAIISRPVATLLAGRHDSIARLQRYWTLTAQIFQMNLAVIPLDEPRVRRAQAVRASYGLLTMDSLLVAAAEDNGTTSFVTLDSDFDDISALTVYKPTDLA
jgi:predicted nucleic acid-binding protein